MISSVHVWEMPPTNTREDGVVVILCLMGDSVEDARLPTNDSAN